MKELGFVIHPDKSVLTPSHTVVIQCRYSMFVNSIYVWNHVQNCHQNVIFHQLRSNKLKAVLITFLLNRYN